MSFERRTALLDFARAHNAFIFEDDYDAEFRFTGPPLPCLQGIDQFRPGDLRRNDEQDSLSLVAPRLHRRAGTAGRFVGQDPQRDGSTFSPIDQATLALFITEGFFLSHIKRMRKIIFRSDEIFSSSNSTRC